MAIARMSYRLMVMFLILVLAVLAPLSFVVFYDTDHMVQSMEDVSPLSHDQKLAQVHGIEKLLDDIVSISFYVSVLAFLISMFFSRRLFLPLRGIYQSAKTLSETDPEVASAIEALRVDDIDELSRTFNGLVESVRHKTADIQRKDMYLAAMTEPMWVLDEDNTVVEVNEVFMRLFGYTREDVIGALVFDLLDESGERQLRRKHYEEELNPATSRPTPFEVSIISKTEGMITVLLTETPIVKDGQFKGRIGMIRDYRRESELHEALTAEKDYSLAVMDSLVDQLVVVDRDMKIVKSNLAARVFAGRDITGEKCYSVFHGSKDECFMHHDDCPAEIVFRTKEAFRCVHEHTEGTGRKIFVEMVIYPLKDQQTGEVRHIVSLMRDVTDRKKFEEQIEIKNRELTALNTISRTLSRSLRAEGVFNDVLDNVVELLGMDGGGIYFIDDTGRELKCQYHRGLSGEFMKTVSWIRMGDDIPGSVALTGASIYATDIAADRRAEKSALKHSGLKGYAAIPIRGKEKVLGILFIFSLRQHVFTQEEERILNSISEMMGISLENMRLYEKMRGLYEQQRQHRSEEQKNLLDLSQTLSSSIEMKDAISGCMAIIKSAMRADMVWMLDINPDASLSVRTSTDHNYGEGMAVYAPDAESIERHAIARRRPVTLGDIVAEDRIQMIGQLQSYRFACAIPMFIGEKTFGAFALYYDTTRRLSEEDVHFLQTVSSVLAVALERAALYERVIIQKGTADTVLESILDGVINVGSTGLVAAANMAAQRLFECPGRKVVGLGMQDFIGNPSENSELQLLMESSIEDALSGKSRHFEATYVGISGHRTPIEVYCSAVRDNRGSIASAVCVVRDLGMATELDKMKTDFLRAVSHEFRTPLTAIVGLTEMVLGGEVEGERASEYLRNVLSEGRRLSAMVSDVLDITRIEGGRETLHIGVVDFVAMFLDIEEGYSPTLTGHGLRLTLHGSDEVRGFIGDAEKLKHLLRNLIDNSISYSASGALIDVSVRSEPGFIVLMVSDTGWGIPPEELQHIGQKFYRGRRAAAFVKGTGLGLSICHSLVSMLGGVMAIESTEGKGTNVTVRIPEATKENS